jgi:hypothetical protein
VVTPPARAGSMLAAHEFQIQVISNISDEYLTPNWQCPLKSAKGTPIKEEEAHFTLRRVAILSHRDA